MTTPNLITDYLIVGSGAVGMAFADTLFHETNARMVIVERHHGSGGHWNDAYPFVRLHQPSAFYGVNSKPLGANGKDATGLNAGMYERATSAELVSYYEQLMQQWVASGGVQNFPMSDYVGDWQNDHRFVSRMSNQTHTVTLVKKIVDTTHLNTAVPFTHPPKYVVAEGVRCVPLNTLGTIKTAPSGYVVVGAGKTGVDACLWLLENGVPPDAIMWTMPRDSCFQNRAKVQPGRAFFYGVLWLLRRPNGNFGKRFVARGCLRQAGSRRALASDGYNGRAPHVPRRFDVAARAGVACQD